MTDTPATTGGDFLIGFGLSIADDSIPWPERGSAEKALSERPGWERRMIQTTKRGEAVAIEAMCHAGLAVNLMLDSEGFAICLADTAFRISYGGSVFCRCADAMDAVESMVAACADWEGIQADGYSESQRSALRTIIGTAERRGEIMLDKVYPS